MEEQKKRKVGRPKGTKNKEGAKAGRPKGSTGSYKPVEEKRNKSISFRVSIKEKEKFEIFFNKNDFKGLSQRDILLKLINEYKN